MNPEQGHEGDAYETEQEPLVSVGFRKLHSTVSHGRKKAENGGWVSLGWSPVLNYREPRTEEPWL